MLNGVPNQDSSLESMRRRMLLDPELIDADPDARLAVDRDKLGAPKAMVVIGGMEGIAEEVAIFLEFRERWRRENPDVISLPPVYAFTSGGGAAQRLLDAPDTFAAGLWPRSERSVSSTELNKRMKRLAILKMARSEGKFIPGGGGISQGTRGAWHGPRIGKRLARFSALCCLVAMAGGTGRSILRIVSPSSCGDCE